MTWHPIHIKMDVIAPIELHPPNQDSFTTRNWDRPIVTPHPTEFQVAGLDMVEWVKKIYTTSPNGFAARFRYMMKDRYSEAHGLKGLAMNWKWETSSSKDTVRSRMHYVDADPDDEDNTDVVGYLVPEKLWEWDGQSYHFDGKHPLTEIKSEGELSDEEWESWVSFDALMQVQELWKMQENLHKSVPEAHIIGYYNPLLLDIAKRFPEIGMPLSEWHISKNKIGDKYHPQLSANEEVNRKNMALLFHKIVSALERRKPFIIVDVSIDGLRVANEQIDHRDYDGNWESSEVVGRRIKLWNKYDGNYFGLKMYRKSFGPHMTLDSLENKDGYAINPLKTGYVNHTAIYFPIYTVTEEGEPCIYISAISRDEKGRLVDQLAWGPYFPKRMAASIEVDAAAQQMVEMGASMAVGSNEAPEYMVDALKAAGLTTGEDWRDEVKQDYEESIEYIVKEVFFPDVWSGYDVKQLNIRAMMLRQQMENKKVDSSKLKEMYDQQTFKKYKFPSEEPLMETPAEELGFEMFDRNGVSYQMGIFGRPEMGLLNWDFRF